MHPARIRAELVVAGSSPPKLAAELKRSESTVRLVIQGRGVSRPIATAIARKVGKTLDELWPGKYPQQGLAARRRRAG